MAGRKHDVEWSFGRTSPTALVITSQDTLVFQGSGKHDLIETTAEGFQQCSQQTLGSVEVVRGGHIMFGDLFSQPIV